MARTIHRILLLSFLAAVCVGGCFLPPADTSNPPAGDPNQPTDSTPTDTTTPTDPGGGGDAPTAPQPPPGPPPVMWPGVWEANATGTQQSFRRDNGGSGPLVDTVTSEQTITLPIGGRFDANGRLTGLRVLGATGYVDLANPGQRIDEDDWWSFSSTIARYHVLESVDYFDDHIVVRLQSSTGAYCPNQNWPPPPLPVETHEYTFTRVGDGVAISASVSLFKTTRWDGAGVGSNLNFDAGPADLIPDAMLPITGSWAFSQVSGYYFNFPRVLTFDGLGRLRINPLIYPGDHDEDVSFFGGGIVLTSMDIAGDARHYEYYTDYPPHYSDPTINIGFEDRVALDITGDSAAPQAQMIFTGRRYRLNSDGSRDTVDSRTWGAAGALALPWRFPVLIAPEDDPGGGPELAGAWEGEVTNADGVARRVGIEFDADGRFSRIRVPHSTGYIGGASSVSGAIFGPIQIEYRPGGTHVVFADYSVNACSTSAARIAFYDFDLTLGSGDPIIVYHEQIDDTPQYGDAIHFDFSGAGSVEHREDLIPGALTGCFTAAFTEFQFSHHCMDNLGRVVSVTSASIWHLGPEYISLGDPEISTPSGAQFNAQFHGWYSPGGYYESRDTTELFTVRSDPTGSCFVGDVNLTWYRTGPIVHESGSGHFFVTAPLSN